MPQSYGVETKTVDALLAPNAVVFEVPPFQRRYAWGPEEVSQLLTDLFDDGTWVYGVTINAQPHYFLGSIVLARGKLPTLR